MSAFSKTLLSVQIFPRDGKKLFGLQTFSNVFFRSSGEKSSNRWNKSSKKKTSSLNIIVSVHCPVRTDCID